MARSYFTSRRMILPSCIVLFLALSLMPARTSAVIGKPLQNATLVLLKPVAGLLNYLGDRIHPPRTIEPQGTAEQLTDRLLEYERELAVLKAEVAQLREENQQLSGARRLFGQDYTYVHANVIGQSTDGKARTLFLDRGSKDGLREGMIAVDGEHLLGRLVDVQHASSVLLPLTAMDHELLVTFGRQTEDPTFIKPAGPDLLKTDEASEKLPVLVGDVARLYGMTGAVRWPPEAQFRIVGRVEKIEPNLDNPLLKHLEIRPLHPLFHLRKVLIVVPKGEAPPTGGSR